MMTPEEESYLIKSLVERGWICDVNTENKLGFIFPVDENEEWIRDYDKKTKRYVHYNGKTKINLRVTKE